MLISPRPAHKGRRRRRGQCRDGEFRSRPLHSFLSMETRALEQGAHSPLSEGITELGFARNSEYNGTFEIPFLSSEVIPKR